ncbi:unnamed protein product, partial [Timema podura]|nr:unnamed protein product [Timema podura]
MKNRGPPPQPPPATYKPFMPTSTSDSVLTSSRGVPSLPSKPPVGGYGKPNLAPKPPITLHKPSPPVKKLMINGGVPRPTVTRAQSMRVPRSPPVAHPADPPDLGTYGALPSFH